MAQSSDCKCHEMGMPKGSCKKKKKKCGPPRRRGRRKPGVYALKVKKASAILKKQGKLMKGGKLDYKGIHKIAKTL